MVKKQMIKEGKLDKYGKPNDKTPSAWMDMCVYTIYVINGDSCNSGHFIWHLLNEIELTK